MGNGVREGQVDFKRQDAEPVTPTHLPPEVRPSWVHAMGWSEVVGYMRWVGEKGCRAALQNKQLPGIRAVDPPRSVVYAEAA